MVKLCDLIYIAEPLQGTSSPKRYFLTPSLLLQIINSLSNPFPRKATNHWNVGDKNVL